VALICEGLIMGFASDKERSSSESLEDSQQQLDLDADVRPGAVVSVLDFGATANDDTDDSRAIEAAIKSLSAEGGTVFFPAGTYRIGSSIVIDRSRITLLGEGIQSVLRLTENATCDLIVMPSVQGTPLSDTPIKDIRI